MQLCKNLGLNCNLLKIGLFFKRNERIGLFSKELGQICKKHNIWTELQFLKMFGLKM